MSLGSYPSTGLGEDGGSLKVEVILQIMNTTNRVISTFFKVISFSTFLIEIVFKS